MRKTFLILLAVLGTIHAFSQHDERILRRELESVIRDFRGEVGIYVRHLKSGLTVGINQDTLFPTASMIKVPITIGVFEKIEKNELDLARETMR